MRALVQWLLDPRCANIVSFLDWSWLCGRDSQHWILPLFREHPEVVDWSELVQHYKPWQRELVAANAHRVDWGVPCRHRYSSTQLSLFRDHAEHLDWDELCRWPNLLLIALFEANIARYSEDRCSSLRASIPSLCTRS